MKLTFTQELNQQVTEQVNQQMSGVLGTMQSIKNAKDKIVDYKFSYSNNIKFKKISASDQDIKDFIDSQLDNYRAVSNDIINELKSHYDEEENAKIKGLVENIIGIAKENLIGIGSERKNPTETPTGKEAVGVIGKLDSQVEAFKTKYIEGDNFKSVFNFTQFTTDLKELLTLVESFNIHNKKQSSSKSNLKFKKISYEINFDNVYAENKEIWDSFREFLDDGNFINLIYKNYSNVSIADISNKLRNLENAIDSEYKKIHQQKPEGLDQAIYKVMNPAGPYPLQKDIKDLIRYLNQIKRQISKSSFNLSSHLRKISQLDYRKNIEENPYEEVDASILELIKDPKNLNINNIDRAISLLEKAKETQTAGNKEEKALEQTYSNVYDYFIKEKIMPKASDIKKKYPKNWRNVISRELKKHSFIEGYLNNIIKDFSGSLFQNPLSPKKFTKEDREKQLVIIKELCVQFQKISNKDLLSEKNFEKQINNLYASSNQSKKIKAVFNLKNRLCK
jgi:hypothetical protein